MPKSTVVDITSEMAILATQISHEQKLGMADSLIYACAQNHEAFLWTQDADFEELEGVRYFEE
jgi:toxin FitB